jgi:hypothetical protein
VATPSSRRRSMPSSAAAAPKLTSLSLNPRAREKRGTCRTGRRIPFCRILFGEILFREIAVGGERWRAGGMDSSAQSPSLFIHCGAARRAPRRTPPAVGAGWCDGRGELRGMRSMAAGCCAQRYWSPVNQPPLESPRAREARPPAAPTAASLFAKFFLAITVGRTLARGISGFDR